MDLSTRYLGIALPHPLMVGASPIVDDMDQVKRAAEAGAAAIVMHSLFEEQLLAEQLAHGDHIHGHGEAHAEAMSYLPEFNPQVGFALGPDAYLERLQAIKIETGLPVIGSLNGLTYDGWVDYAELIASAGADALELNVYHVPIDPLQSGQNVEEQTVELVRGITRRIDIPVAVKLSPFYSSLPHLARELHNAGAAGLVLFNRFYEADIDVAQQELAPTLHLSTPDELRLRLRFIAALRGRVPLSLAVTGGVHSGEDALKAVMAGADGVQMVSALLRHGPEHIGQVRRELEALLVQYQYDSLTQIQGSMSLLRCPDPTPYERGNYLRILHSWPRY